MLGKPLLLGTFAALAMLAGAAAQAAVPVELLPGIAVPAEPLPKQQGIARPLQFAVPIPTRYTLDTSGGQPLNG